MGDVNRKQRVMDWETGGVERGQHGAQARVPVAQAGRVLRANMIVIRAIDGMVYVRLQAGGCRLQVIWHVICRNVGE